MGVTGPKMILVVKPGLREAIIHAGFRSVKQFAEQVRDQYGKPSRPHIMNLTRTDAGSYGMEISLAENVAAVLGKPVADLFCLPGGRELPR